MKIFPLHAKDCYKTGHVLQYPENTTMVYSNFTPRSNRLSSIPEHNDKVVFFGLQGFMQWFLVDMWNEQFFNKHAEEVVARYTRRLAGLFGPNKVTIDHIRGLHDLGYLPLHVKALPEGSRVPMRVPVYTVSNTHPDFYWLTNMLETAFSSESWKSTTTATTAHAYRRLLEEFAEKTGSPKDFVMWQGHDFSARGASSMYDAAQSQAGHLLSFYGSDTILAIDYLEDYYGADTDKELVGGSVPATEHSVMCMGSKESEIETFRRLITGLYPSGVVSIVSDTWDFWKVITEYAAELKDEILARTPNELGLAKVVFRPDSGGPVDILCGTVKSGGATPAEKGAVECLWDLFGGTESETGHKILNERVGLIYGDSITYSRAKEILTKLEAKGFASCNCVFGIGSYTYQYVTRDTYGFAMKATYGEVNGEPVELFKDPITDSGVKKSAKGLLRVELEDGEYALYDQQTKEQEAQGELKTVFLDGIVLSFQTLSEIREKLV